MNKAVRLYLIFLLTTWNCISFAQSSFTINYYFKLNKENGKALTRRDYLNNKICVHAMGGKVEKFGYISDTKYFYVKIHTTWPVFSIIWKHKNQLMRISVEHATQGKDIYLDSIAFKPNSFLISGDLRKHITFEDDNKRHLLFQDISEYRLSQEATIVKDKDKDIKCW